MQRLKTLCIILLFVFFASMYQGAVLPFIEGIKYGLSIAAYEKETNINTREFLMMDVEPRNGASSIPNDINLINGTPVIVQPTNISIISNDINEKPVWLMMVDALDKALLVIVLVLGIWIPFLVIRILRSLQGAWVFERINLKRIQRIGMFLIAIGVLSSIIQLVNILSAEYLVDLAQYRFVYSKVVDFNTLIMGIVILIMNEVLRIAIDLKEEQNLTI